MIPAGSGCGSTCCKPVTSDHVTLVQPYTVPATRTISKAELTFSGGGEPATTVDVDMTPASLTKAGQVVRFPSRSFTQVEFKIIQTSNGTLNSYDGQSGVGLARAGRSPESRRPRRSACRPTSSRPPAPTAPTSR